jgi:hypothetical protein
LAALGALGVVTYAWLLVEGIAGGAKWLTALANTTNPLVRGAHVMLPDFAAQTWLLGTQWLAGLAVLAAVASRAARWKRDAKGHGTAAELDHSRRR